MELMRNFPVCFYIYMMVPYLVMSKIDKPILIMEDKYIIDEDGLLYRVDIPRQKNLARL